LERSAIVCATSGHLVATACTAPLPRVQKLAVKCCLRRRLWLRFGYRRRDPVPSAVHGGPAFSRNRIVQKNVAVARRRGEARVAPPAINAIAEQALLAARRRKLASEDCRMWSLQGVMFRSTLMEDRSQVGPGSLRSPDSSESVAWPIRLSLPDSDACSRHFVNHEPRSAISDSDQARMMRPSIDCSDQHRGPRKRSCLPNRG
jgi:hypothetical protein